MLQAHCSVGGVEQFTTHHFAFALGAGRGGNAGATRSKYVWSSMSVAGFGSAKDHRTKTHGWDLEDYASSHNLTATSLYGTRNYMLTNIGVSTAPLGS